MNGHVGLGIANDLYHSAWASFTWKEDESLPVLGSGIGSAATVYQSRIGNT